MRVFLVVLVFRDDRGTRPVGALSADSYNVRSTRKPGTLKDILSVLQGNDIVVLHGTRERASGEHVTVHRDTKLFNLLVRSGCSRVVVWV